MKVTPFRDHVDLIEFDGRSLYLIATAHVSQVSADLADELIREIRPEAVAVELCQPRYEALQDPNRWKNMDIIQVIREGRAYVLLAQLILVGFQKKIGNQLQVAPGTEMLQAIRTAKEIGSEIILTDREIKITLKRIWRSLRYRSLWKLLEATLEGLFQKQEVSKEQVENLKETKALQELLVEFANTFPEIQNPLLHERDQYMAEVLRRHPAKTIVAVIGAAHTPGIKHSLSSLTDLEALQHIPSKSIFSRLISWSIPVLFLSVFIYAFLHSGSESGVRLLWSWSFIMAGSSALGALVALAHPLTIIAAGVSAPFTTFPPFRGAGIVAAIVEAFIRKPRVSDLEQIADDIGSVKGWYRNRVTRILLILILANTFGLIGIFFGASVIASYL